MGKDSFAALLSLFAITELLLFCRRLVCSQRESQVGESEKK